MSWSGSGSSGPADADPEPATRRGERVRQSSSSNPAPRMSAFSPVQPRGGPTDTLPGGSEVGGRDVDRHVRHRPGRSPPPALPRLRSSLSQSLVVTMIVPRLGLGEQPDAGPDRGDRRPGHDRNRRHRRLSPLPSLPSDLLGQVDRADPLERAVPAPTRITSDRDRRTWKTLLSAGPPSMPERPLTAMAPSRLDHVATDDRRAARYPRRPGSRRRRRDRRLHVALAKGHSWCVFQRQIPHPEHPNGDISDPGASLGSLPIRASKRTADRQKQIGVAGDPDSCNRGGDDAGPCAEVGHIVLFVADLDRSLALYRDILGWPVIWPQGRHPIAGFHAGSTHHDLLLIEVGSSAQPLPKDAASASTTSA